MLSSLVFSMFAFTTLSAAVLATAFSAVFLTVGMLFVANFGVCGPPVEVRRSRSQHHSPLFTRFEIGRSCGADLKTL